MQKKLFFAAAAAVMAGALLAAPAQAATSCGEMAKAKATSMMERVQMRRDCRKAMRTEKRDGMFSRLNFMKGRS